MTALVMVNLGVAGLVVVAAAVFVMSGTATLAFLGVVDASPTSLPAGGATFVPPG